MIRSVCWDSVISTIASVGSTSTKERKLREFTAPRWSRLKALSLAETTGAYFLEVLNQGGVATSGYLASGQALALDTGMLSHPILPKRMWPRHSRKQKRAVTESEHCRLRSNSCHLWSAYLEVLWQTGASQSDAAQLRIELTDLSQGVVNYHRQKTGTRAAQQLSPELTGMLRDLAGDRRKGFFIPHIANLSANARASCFRKKCLTLKIEGISLHSYRYGWAERAFELGVPERLAMVALGHNSRAVHQAYAKGAKLVCPSLSDYSKEKTPASQGA